MTNAVSSPTDDGVALHPSPGGWNRLRWVLLFALLARLLALAVWSENLTDDRDGYLALAEGLAAGRGFSVPETDTPTAFRPPLYPLVLVPIAFLPSGVWTGALHVVLGLVTVWLTWALGLRLCCRDSLAVPDDRLPIIAALLVAIDPLLLRYATLPMTETLATCLVTALLVAMAPPVHGLGSSSYGAEATRWWRHPLAVGVLFGLAALCRPTVWAFAALMGFGCVGRWIFVRSTGVQRLRQTSTVALMIAAAAIVMLPWGVRNFVHFGKPILMTTHGGYTLLLGNNPAFYREVVDQPWGTVWDGTIGGGQVEWAEEIDHTLDDAGIEGETARDHWMSNRAWAIIAERPGDFVRACWLRLRRFWGVVPVEGASDQRVWVRWSVGGFYSLLLLAAAVGLVRVLTDRAWAWMPSLLMVAAFMGVHLVYWTNTRMRCPVVPVIALLGAYSLTSLHSCSLRTGNSVSSTEGG